MNIDANTIKHYLKNVYFINGTAYAGKSTMVAMLAKEFDMIHCGENYHDSVASKLVTPEKYPNLGYFQTMSGWQEFINRTPEEYENWFMGVVQEVIEFELAELISISKSKKVIVDTNIPVDLLKEIADYNQVAIMLTKREFSVNRFFDRSDSDKQFLLQEITKADNPEKTMKNFRQCISQVNSERHYNEFLNSGFFTLIRENPDEDTRAETLEALVKHFGL